MQRLEDRLDFLPRIAVDDSKKACTTILHRQRLLDRSIASMAFDAAIPPVELHSDFHEIQFHQTRYSLQILFEWIEAMK